MTLHVYTGRLSPKMKDPDRLDITRQSAGPDGIFMAPSWDLLRPAIDARQKADALRVEAKRLNQARLFEPVARDTEYAAWAVAMADKIETDMWLWYVDAFLAEMRVSAKRNRTAWDRLLSRQRVVLLCVCNHEHRDHCHRAILRATILPKFGAIDCGEIT